MDPRQATIHVTAHAKLNLGLEILRKRPDGYHDIRSVFATISVADDISVSPSSTIELECIPEMTDKPEQNLAYKAAKAILAHPSADGRGAKITLRKRIPAGGGLGGGSSDAAAVLTAIRSLYDLPINSEELHTLAASLGSDIPFFLTGGTALVEGRGEIVTPVDIHIPYSVIVVFPHIHVDTAEAYQMIRPYERGSSETLLEAVATIDRSSTQVINDFEQAVFPKYTILQHVKDVLLNHGALYASMSGSGSTMFGLFTSVDTFAELRSALPQMDVLRCTFTSAQPRSNTP